MRINYKQRKKFGRINELYPILRKLYLFVGLSVVKFGRTESYIPYTMD